MRLLYFTRHGNSHDERFLRKFQETRVQVGMLTLTPGGRVEHGKAHSLGALLPADSDKNGGLAQGVAAYRRAEAAFAPDLVVAGPLGDCGFVKAAAGTATPWVAQSWAFDVFWEAAHETRTAKRIRAALTDCDGIFVDCNAVLGMCAVLAGEPMAPAFIMPWGLERMARPCGVTVDGPSARGRTVFIYCRGLAPIYGPNFLVRSWARFVAQRSDVVLWLAGGGPMADEVRALVDELGVGSSVEFLGRQPHEQLLQLMRSADVYVSSSACDGTSVSLLEAMAEGLPAVATRCGGNDEWIEEGTNGWLVEFGEVDRLAAALQQAVTMTPEAREACAAYNRRVLSERADWDRNFSDYLRFLEHVAYERRPSCG